MSHYVVGVIYPSDTKDPQATIDRLLTPFDENMDVDEYDKPCHCIGDAAQAAANAAANAAHGTIGSLRDKLKAELPMPSMKGVEEWWDTPGYKAWKAESERRWEILLTPWQDAHKAALEADPRRESPNPTCETCSGSGSYKSTYNPQSKWDWYDVGGRWYGFLTQNEEKFGEENWSDFYRNRMGTPISQKLLDNTCRVRDIPDGKSEVFFALVTPDGEWIAEGKMGWWAIKSDVTEDWPAIRSEVLSSYPEHLITSVDLHI